MSTELATRAADVEMLKRKDGQLVFHKFSVLGGWRFVEEFSADKNVVTIPIEAWAKAFHGTAHASNRKRVKRQVRRVYKAGLEDGHLIVPKYADNGELAGVVRIKNLAMLDEEERQEILVLISKWADRARRQRELKDSELKQLDRIIASQMPDEDSDG